ncbi:hypothetical protein [Candidatus Enterovibrio escicola]|nr:hypothetical protein [Candidatus Enterovibrio escacola]
MPKSEIVLEVSTGESSERHMMIESTIHAFYRYYNTKRYLTMNPEPIEPAIHQQVMTFYDQIIME